MTRVTADTTDNIGSEVLRFWAVVLAMTDLATVLASLILIVTQRTIECCELT